MTSYPLRNSEAVLVEEGGRLLVDAGKRYPVDIGVLTLTSRCDLDCVMCLEPADVERGLDLPYEEAAKLVDLFAGKVPRIWSCAGETLQHPRFFDLAREIRARGTLLGVGTNGLALAKPGVLERCAEAGVEWLHISCHTSQAQRFAALSGRGSPRTFEALARALGAVDAWNHGHPERRFQVIVQLVLMKGFLDEIDEYFAFLKERLPHTRFLLRVEPMQPLGRGRARPELALDVAELAGTVDAILARRAPWFELEFKSVPLCLLEGREALSEDLRCMAAGALRVGNISCLSSDLQLVCAVGDPERGTAAATCRGCGLKPLCPGVMDVPVPAGCSLPRPAKSSPAQVLERAGLGPGFLRREEAPVYPLAADGPQGPRPLSAERLGVDLAAGRRFTAAQKRLLETLPGAEPGVVVAEATVCDAFAAVRLGGDGAVVVFEPAAPEVPNFFTRGGVAVRYNGELAGELPAFLDAARRRLEELA